MGHSIQEVDEGCMKNQPANGYGKEDGRGVVGGGLERRRR